MRTAFITGVTSQDGSYLAERLIKLGYKVYGLIRRTSSPNMWRLAGLVDNMTLVPGDMTDQSSLDNLIGTIQPDEVYNLAAQSYFKYSFDAPLSTCDITGMGTLRLLESIRKCSPKSRMFQASTSEMFGKIEETPQNELTRFYPRSPYGAAKAFAHHLCVNYRETYKLHISCGIMFNHESPRRGLEFVTRKITDGVARVKCGLQKTVRLGTLETKRDFGFAGDFMRGAWMMLQGEPDDYVLATGVTHSVYNFLEEACHLAELNPKEVYEIDPQLKRPGDIDHLRGNITKIKSKLSWTPTVPFKTLVQMMYEEDLARVKAEYSRNL